MLIDPASFSDQLFRREIFNLWKSPNTACSAVPVQPYKHSWCGHMNYNGSIQKGNSADDQNGSRSIEHFHKKKETIKSFKRHDGSTLDTE